MKAIFVKIVSLAPEDDFGIRFEREVELPIQPFPGFHYYDGNFSQVVEKVMYDAETGRLELFVKADQENISVNKDDDEAKWNVEKAKIVERYDLSGWKEIEVELEGC